MAVTITTTFISSKPSLSSSHGFSSFSRRRHHLLLRPRASAAPEAYRSVDVIGIGSRKDALIDSFLHRSSLSSPSPLRFWTLQWSDSQKVQLLQRCRKTDVALGNMEFVQLLDQHSPAVILVASSGQGFDHIAAMELLNSVKCAGGLAVAIVLKPFSFEGQRRQKEVDALVKKLHGCSHLYIAIEADALHKGEVQTLAEALEGANNAVSLAVNTISSLMSDLYLKILNYPDGEMKEIDSVEVLNLLDTYGEAKAGFGSGYNLKSAIMQAVSSCQFQGRDLRDLNGHVVLTVTSSCAINKSDMPSAIHNFRRLTKCTVEVIVSQIHEPDMEPNLIVTTVLIAGCYIERDSKKTSFLSRLAVHLPFLYFFLGRDDTDTKSVPLTDSLGEAPANEVVSPINDTMSGLHVESALNTNPEDMSNSYSTRESSPYIDPSELKNGSANHYINEGFEREHSNWSIGPGFHIAQLWAKERENFLGAKIGMTEFITLPAGVKLSESTSDSSPYSEPTTPENVNHTSFESQVPNGRNGDDSRKRGLLSARAATMLESERESPMSWSPIIELQYRGGTYKGYSQSGLPDGKGRLTFEDGSFYDGVWRYGKRSGLGTFCYSNGDVFQGTWRDDLMHGRGWFYFHTGDRWFANFWKGKANGEGRFYSKNGSIFFGNFKDGWRHGEGQFIDVDGSRWTEVWNEGVLISRSCSMKGSESVDE